MNERLPAHIERITDIERDTEVTARLLGALGLVDALQFEYDNPEHHDSQWIGLSED